MSKIEGRLNHRNELKRHLVNVECAKLTRRWTVGGWGLVAVWGIWVLISYLIS